MQDAYYVEGQPDGDPRKLMGTVVRYQITAGQPVTRGSLVGPEDRGFLAAALGPGMRAITVPVNVIDRRRRLRLPGRPCRPHAHPAGRRRWRRSRAQGRRDDHPQPAGARYRPAHHRKDDDGKTQVKTFANVTFEVTPKIAEKIAVAQSLGTLSLSLRSIADNRSELERAVASGDVKVPAGATPAQEKQMLQAMANRPMDSNTTFSRAATCRASSAARSPPRPQVAVGPALVGLGAAAAPRVSVWS